MIYLDNAATTWPKPKSVIREMENCLINYCANPGRSGHSMAQKTEDMIFSAREKTASLFGISNPANVIFTLNATMGLNMVIQSILKKQSHAVATSMEHNSVLRPLAATEANYDVIPADEFGYVSAKDAQKYIRKDTSLVVCTLSSNVCGSVQPYKEIAEIAHKNNVPFLLDASQGAGAINIDMEKENIDFLAAPGHKGLLGPTGTGVLCINSKSILKPIMYGGTGSDSKLLVQPKYNPDRFESGTINVVGIAGLKKGIEYIEKTGIQKIREHENRLVSYLADKLSNLKNVKLVGYDPKRERIGVLSFVIDGMDSMLVSHKLNVDYSIASRAGFHCAYTAHCSLGTKDTGTVRISAGAFNTMEEMDKTYRAIKEISLQK